MKKIDFKILVITSLVCLLSIIVGVIFYEKLPEQVAIHFDVQNNANNYFPKAVFIFGVPIFMTLLQIFTCVVNDLQDKNKEANKKAATVFKWLVPIITIIMYCVTISVALGNNLDMRKIVMILLGIMLIIMGNYLPKTKGNIYLHLKNTNENLINSIAKLAGYVLIIDGILFILSILFNPIVSIIMVALLLLETVVLYIYSIIENNKL